MCKSTVNYNDICFSNYVKYDTNSPTGLTWVFCTKKRFIGKPAGCFRKNKAGASIEVSIKILNKSYRVHRVIWILANGVIDACKVIDHVDGNPWNNEISNLRLVTTYENLRNKSILLRNKSGHTGVYYSDTNGCPSYIAKCSVGNKHFSRSFSIAKHGEDMSKQLAINWRKDKLKELEKDGIFYSERHGT